MKYIIASLLIGIMFIELQGQDMSYYFDSKKASDYYESGNIDSAYKYYLKIVKNYNIINPWECYTAAQVFYEKKDTLNTSRMIKQIIKYGRTIDNILHNKENEKIINFLKQTNEWGNIVETKSEVNNDILRQIKIMMDFDQYIRFQNNDSCNLHFMAIVDSINTENIISLIKKYGYPGFSELGFNDDILILIMHSTTNVSTEKYWESFFKPLLYQEALKGNISLYNYALVFDRHMFWKENMQYYGTYNYMDGFLPIKDIETVDKRREEFGLSTLKKYSIQMNFALPDNYKE